MSVPAVGSTVTVGRIDYEVIRHGCATEWSECPHGDRAVTVRRVKGCQLAECYDTERLEPKCPTCHRDPVFTYDLDGEQRCADCWDGKPRHDLQR
jgi:hypothetical protein